MTDNPQTIYTCIKRYNELMQKRLNQLLSEDNVDETELSGTMNKIKAAKHVEMSITHGQGIPTDVFSDGIIMRAIDSKVSELKGQQLENEKEAEIAAIKLSYKAPVEQEPTPPPGDEVAFPEPPGDDSSDESSDIQDDPRSS